VRLVPNIKPALLRDHPHYAELAAKGWFVKDADGDPIECQFWDELGAYVDFTNPDAAAWWRGQVTAQLLDYGIASTWNDNNEYEIWDRRARIDGFGAPRPAAAERPVQTLLMMRASRQAQRAHDPRHRPYVVTRSGMAGMQRYAQTWSGDNNTSWNRCASTRRWALAWRCRAYPTTGTTSAASPARARTRTAAALGAGGHPHAAFLDPQLEHRSHGQRTVDVSGDDPGDRAADGAAAGADPAAWPPALAPSCPLRAGHAPAVA
jgi:hypothetical protein